MAIAENFNAGETIPLSVGTSSSNISFTLPQSAVYPDCLIVNAGTSLAFVGFGGTAYTPGTGVTNATPLFPNAGIIIKKGSQIQCCAITLTGSTTLYFTAGEGY